MKNNHTYLRQCYMALFATLFLLLFGSLPSHARDPIFAYKSNYTAYVSGYNKVHFRLPLYDYEGLDRWANNIRVQANGITIFRYSTEAEGSGKCTADHYNQGDVQIWTTTNYQDVLYDKKTFSVPEMPGDEHYVEFEWYAPTNWSGEYQTPSRAIIVGVDMTTEI